MKNIIVYLFACTIFSGLNTIAFSQTSVQFNAASVPLSPFKIKKAKAKGIELRPKPGESLSGFLYIPEGSGKFPAIIMSHDCRGIQQYQKDWAEFLKDAGYLVLIIDSYTPRGRKDICAELNTLGFGSLIGGRSYDIFGGLNYLVNLPNVKANKIALIGWDPTDTLTMVSSDSSQIQAEGTFSSAVSFYTDCKITSSGKFSVPVLILIGENDDWWSNVQKCQDMAESGMATGSIIDFVVLPKAQYAFDDEQYAVSTWREDVYNPNKNPTNGATFHFDKQATITARESITKFLKKHLM
jgi:dienelactone hydrolase